MSVKAKLSCKSASNQETKLTPSSYYVSPVYGPILTKLKKQTLCSMPAVGNIRGEGAKSENYNGISSFIISKIMVLGVLPREF